jgi:hypothetical protein
MTVTEAPDDTVPPSGEPDAFDELWARLARPFEMVPTVAAVVGLPVKAVSQLIGTAVATSPEAERLLDEFPKTVRSLATSIHTHAERCIGSLRGPVLWSETMSARASSFGDPDLFVCSTPSRAYDIDENQVLAYALHELRDAARLAEEAAGVRALDDPFLRSVRRNGAEAARALDHPSLRAVTKKRPTARALKRTRSGKHHKSYEPALAMFERALHPLDADEVRAWCDQRTRAQHWALIGVVRRLEAHGGGRLPDFRAEKDSLYAGPVQYHHGRQLGSRQHTSGIVIGQLLIDVPDRIHDPNRRRAEEALRARRGSRRTMVIMDDSDLDLAVERAIELAREA